jgi:hypothetical protein
MIAFPYSRFGFDGDGDEHCTGEEEVLSPVEGQLERSKYGDDIEGKQVHSQGTDTLVSQWDSGISTVSTGEHFSSAPQPENSSGDAMVELKV